MHLGGRVSAVLAVALSVSTAANADHCTSRVQIFGRTAVPTPQGGDVGVWVPSPAGAVCAVTSDEALDARVLPPGANQIYVRLDMDFGMQIPNLDATLDGLGFDGSEIELARAPDGLQGGLAQYPAPLNTFSYVSGPLDIALGAGRITATVTLPGGSTRSTTYRTLP